MTDVKTNYIVPVDLNCLVFMNYMCLAEFYSYIGDAEVSDKFMTKAERLQTSIAAVFWDDEEAMWFDYDFLNDVSYLYRRQVS